MNTLSRSFFLFFCVPAFLLSFFSSAPVVAQESSGSVNTLSFFTQDFLATIRSCSENTVCNDDGYVIVDRTDDDSDVEITYTYRPGTTVPEKVAFNQVALWGIGLARTEVTLREDMNIDRIRVLLLNLIPVRSTSFSYEFWDTGAIRQARFDGGILGDMSGEGGVQVSEHDPTGRVTRVYTLDDADAIIRETLFTPQGLPATEKETDADAGVFREMSYLYAPDGTVRETTDVFTYLDGSGSSKSVTWQIADGSAARFYENGELQAYREYDALGRNRRYDSYQQGFKVSSILYSYTKDTVTETVTEYDAAGEVTRQDTRAYPFIPPAP